MALSYSATTSSKVVAQDCQVDRKVIQATGNSLFVGTPGGSRAAHYTGVPFGVGGNSTLDLGVYTDEAICFFTKISGKFRGSGESVRLYTESTPSGWVWHARSRQGSGGSSVRAEGRCFYYNQWDL
ncbi:MAG TPA: hypothetical protein VER33_26725 [Polyangiaceae bacterium]|nr:hypothetical protein [Polyangiaceae bacterium]